MMREWIESMIKVWWLTQRSRIANPAINERDGRAESSSIFPSISSDAMTTTSTSSVNQAASHNLDTSRSTFSSSSTCDSSSHLWLHVFLCGWASSSWSKATRLMRLRDETAAGFLDHGDEITSRSHVTLPCHLESNAPLCYTWVTSQVDMTRNMSIYYLLVAYSCIRITQTDYFLRNRLIGKLQWKDLAKLFISAIWSITIDELSILITTLFFSRSSGMVLLPTSETDEISSIDEIEPFHQQVEKEEECCMICLESSANNHKMTSTETMPSDSSNLSLQSFCSIPSHKAHWNCLRSWLQVKGVTQTCPLCRRPLNVQSCSGWTLLKRYGFRVFSCVVASQLRLNQMKQRSFWNLLSILIWIILPSPYFLSDMTEASMIARRSNSA